jgi:hypothetical protein
MRPGEAAVAPMTTRGPFPSMPLKGKRFNLDESKGRLTKKIVGTFSG